MPREVNPERLMRDMERVLKHDFWPDGLEVETLYARTHDDHDGTKEGAIGVSIAQDGDVWPSFELTHDMKTTLRFRTEFGGGGQSPIVRRALLILAYAIKKENEQRPQ